MTLRFRASRQSRRSEHAPDPSGQPQNVLQDCLGTVSRSFNARWASHVINKDGVLGTHSHDERRSNAQSPLEAVGSLSELINERGRSLIQIIEGMPLTMIINPSHQYFSVFSSRHITLRLSTVLIEGGYKP
jgi:hypothetical protein